MKILKAIKKGFTLVELVIVIAVIAVLSAVLIPIFGNVVKDSRISALRASLKTCSSNLVMYSLYNQVDYYTPSVIREFLKSEGIDGLTSEDSKFCEDGYSIWYNQANYNFYLIKNEELPAFVNGGSSSAAVNEYGHKVAYAADGSDMADTGATQNSGTDAGASAQLKRLSRRPEAITPDANLLLVATDKANRYILSGIETLYTGADTDKHNSTAAQIMYNVKNEMDNGNLFKYFGGEWKIDNYAEQFDVASTAWLNNVGNFMTDAAFNDVGEQKMANISNVIVSPNLGLYSESVTDGNKITGNIRSISDASQDLTGAVLNVSCVIEIASVNPVELVAEFYQKFSNAGVSIVISGNVQIDSLVSTAVSSGTNRVSTVTGGGMNISSVVSAGGGSAVAGGGNKIITSTIPASEFLTWTTSGSDGKTVINYSTVTDGGTEDNKKTLVSVKLPDGSVRYETVDETFFDNAQVTVGDKTESVPYKYNTSSYSINVAEFLKKAGITSDEQIRSVRVRSDAYNNVYSTSVYLEYEVNNVISGKSFNFGIGHITSFDYYYRYYNKDFDSKKQGGENTVPEYIGIDADRNQSAGSLLVKLPDGTLNLQSYKSEDFKIEVFYKKVTRYYKEEQSEFGTAFKELLNTESSETEKSVSWVGKSDPNGKIGDSYLIDFGSFERLGEPSAESKCKYFVNTVSIERIVIRDKDNNIMIVRYPGYVK